jgi:hypothetical protein
MEFDGSVSGTAWQFNFGVLSLTKLSETSCKKLGIFVNEHFLQ